MQKYTKILRKVFVLPPVPALLISIPSYALVITITGIMGVIQVIRQGIDKHPLVMKALVAMLSLEIAMLTQFGSDDDLMFRRIMTASTGAGISIIVLGMAIFMIWRSTKQLKQCKQEKEI